VKTPIKRAQKQIYLNMPSVRCLDEVKSEKCIVLIPLILISVLCSCTGRGNYTPKPKGYLRVEPPAAQYTTFDEAELPYAFSLSGNATIELPLSNSAACWMNIDYPGLNAKIYCSYERITTLTLSEHTEDCFKLAERAAGNAGTINEKSYENKESNVYGTLFLIEGEATSPIQFMLTDSISHFFRGALYYKDKTNTDSIAPVTDYFKKDIAEIIQTFYWKK